MTFSLCARFSPSAPQFPHHADMVRLGSTCDDSGDHPESILKDPLRLLPSDAANDDVEFVARGAFARFCALSKEKQRDYVLLLRYYISALTHANAQSPTWLPSDDFARDMIIREYPDRTIATLARLEYQKCKDELLADQELSAIGIVNIDLFSPKHHGGHSHDWKALTDGSNEEMNDWLHHHASPLRQRIRLQEAKHRNARYRLSDRRVHATANPCDFDADALAYLKWYEDAKSEARQEFQATRRATTTPVPLELPKENVVHTPAAAPVKTKSVRVSRPVIPTRRGDVRSFDFGAIEDESAFFWAGIIGHGRVKDIGRHHMRV
jgi:hypothetical protein